MAYYLASRQPKNCLKLFLFLLWRSIWRGLAYHWLRTTGLGQTLLTWVKFNLKLLRDVTVTLGWIGAKQTLEANILISLLYDSDWQKMSFPFLEKVIKNLFFPCYTIMLFAAEPTIFSMSNLFSIVNFIRRFKSGLVPKLCWLLKHTLCSFYHSNAQGGRQSKRVDLLFPKQIFNNW